MMIRKGIGGRVAAEGTALLLEPPPPGELIIFQHLRVHGPSVSGHKMFHVPDRPFKPNE